MIKARNSNLNRDCRPELISAYIDGELSAPAEDEFEGHLRSCSGCAKELNDQKKLLCALDLALDKGGEMQVPKDFTRTVVANAESKVSGLRLPKERFRAFAVCAALFLLLLIGLGEESNAVFAAFGKFSEKLLAVGGFVFHLIHDFAVGIAVVSRTLWNRFVISQALSPAILLVFFLVAAYAFSRIFYRQDRT